jgi:hypothetical protein
MPGAIWWPIGGGSASAAATALRGSSFESLEAGDELVQHVEEEFRRELMDQAMLLA